MNFISLNVCGIREEVKVNWIRKQKNRHKSNYVGIQETQIVDYSQTNMNGCWGYTIFDFEGVNSCRRFGGMLFIQNKDWFKKKREVIKNGF